MEGNGTVEDREVYGKGELDKENGSEEFDDSEG